MKKEGHVISICIKGETIFNEAIMAVDSFTGTFLFLSQYTIYGSAPNEKGVTPAINNETKANNVQSYQRTFIPLFNNLYWYANTLYQTLKIGNINNKKNQRKKLLELWLKELENNSPILLKFISKKNLDVKNINNKKIKTTIEKLIIFFLVK